MYNDVMCLQVLVYRDPLGALDLLARCRLATPRPSLHHLPVSLPLVFQSFFLHCFQASTPRGGFTWESHVLVDFGGVPWRAKRRDEIEYA
jgi:hypothetical protein